MICTSYKILIIIEITLIKTNANGIIEIGTRSQFEEISFFQSLLKVAKDGADLILELNELKRSTAW